MEISNPRLTESEKNQREYLNQRHKSYDNKTAADYYLIYSRFKANHSSKAYSWPMEYLEQCRFEIKMIAFSPCGMFLTTLEDKFLRFWNLKLKIEEFRIEDEIDDIDYFSISPNGSLVATLSKSIKIWRVDERKVEFMIYRCRNGNKNQTISSDKSTVKAFSSISFEKGWDYLKETVNRTEYMHDQLCFSFTPDNRFLAVGSLGDVIRFWNLHAKREMFNMIIESMATYLSFSNNSKFLASGYKNIIVWNLNDYKQEFTLCNQYSDIIVYLEFSYDCKYLAVVSRSLKVWKLEEKLEIFTASNYQTFSKNVSFSHDSRSILYITSFGSLDIFNLIDKHKEFTLNISLTSINCFTISNDNKFLAIASKESLIQVYNLLSKQEEYCLNEQLFVKSFAFSRNSKFLAIAFNDLQFWNLKTCQRKFSLNPESDLILCISFSSNDKLIACGSQDNNIIIFNIKAKTMKCKLKGHTGSVTHVLFSDDDQLLFSASLDKCIRIWSLIKIGEFSIKRETSKIFCLSFFKNRLFYVIGGQYLKALGWPEFQGYKLLNYSCSIFEFSFDGLDLAISNGFEILIWDLSENVIKSSFKMSRLCKAMCFSPDSKILAIATDSSILLRNLLKNTIIFCIQHNFLNISFISFSPDGVFLAVRSDLNRIKLWNVNESREDETRININTENLSDISSRIRYFFSYLKNYQDEEFISKSYFDQTNLCVAYSPNGYFLAAGSTSIIILNLKTKTEIMTLKDHSSKFYSLSFSPNSNFLALGSQGIMIWNIEALKKEFILSHHESLTIGLAYSPNGRYLASECLNKKILLWNLNSRAIELSLEFNENLKSPLILICKELDIKDLRNCKSEMISCLMYSPNGSFMVAGSYKNSLIVWNMPMGTVFLSTNLKNTCSAFSPDSKFLVSADPNGQVRMLNLQNKRIEFFLNFFSEKYPAIRLEFTKDSKFLWIGSKDLNYKLSFEDKLCFMTNQNLAKCVKSRGNLEDIYEDAKAAVFLINFNQRYIKSMNKVEAQLSKLISQLILDYSVNRCPNLAYKVSDYLRKFSEIGVYLNSLSSFATNILKNYFPKIKRKKNQSLNHYISKILTYFKDSNDDYEPKDFINLYKCRFLYDSKLSLKLISKSSFMTRFKNIKKINRETIPKSKYFKVFNQEYYNIHYSKSEYFGQKVLIKNYTLKNFINYHAKKKLWNEFKKEAICYETLFDIKKIFSFPGEYFGCITTHNSFSIITKDFGESLEDFIDNLSKDKEQKVLSISLWLAIRIINNLLKAFAYLESQNILHRHINPSCIKINEDYQVIITNFLYSAININGSWYQPDRTLLPREYLKYCSPEEKSHIGSVIDLEKCDVYSLGLTILNFVTLKSISEIEEKLEIILDGLDLMNAKCLHKLLRNMLNHEPENRLCFRKLVNISDAIMLEFLKIWDQAH